MDPIGLAGLGLAALTLPGQVFTTSVVAYTTISQVQGMGKMFGRYYSQFKIQEGRYIFWGTYHNACNPGGLDPTQMPKIIFETVLSTLIQINSLLADRDTLISKYGLKRVVPTPAADGTLGHRIIPEVSESLVQRECSKQQNVVRRLQKSSSLLRKVEWAVRDQARFAELVQQLAELINVLYECLPVQGGPYVEDYIKAGAVAEMLLGRAQFGTVALAAIEGENNDLELRDLQIIDRAAIVSESREQDFGGRVPVAMQQMNLPPPFDVRYLDLSHEMNVPNTATHIRSWVRPRETNPFNREEFMVVEWRNYSAQRDQGDGAGSRPALKTALKLRIQALVNMLREKPRSDSFRVLDCLGFFEDNQQTRFGVTFRLPQGYNLLHDPPPRTLFDVIVRTSQNPPYLGDRFRLSYLLAESIHALHTTGWLHKSICSKNILLFPKRVGPEATESQRPDSLENPYFTGFALSRPDDPAESLSLSLDSRAIHEMSIYRDPSYLKYPKYRAIYDIYSLGIVLIELATWRVIKKLCPPNPEANFDFRTYLLEQVVPGIGAGMGERYMNVVKKCLLGNFERLSAWGEVDWGTAGYKENVRSGLLWEVVTVLRDCRA